MEEETQAQEAAQRRYLTVPEVAEILRISRSLAYAAVRRGHIPCVRVGHIVRVPADWLDQYNSPQDPRPAA